MRWHWPWRERHVPDGEQARQAVADAQHQQQQVSTLDDRLAAVDRRLKAARTRGDMLAAEVREVMRGMP